MAAAAIKNDLPPLTIYPNAKELSAWTPTGRALRADFTAEAERQIKVWRQNRYWALSAEQRAAFRTWVSSIQQRSAAMPRTQTGGYNLLYSVLDYTIRTTDQFANYASLSNGKASLLVPEAGESVDWVGSDPPAHQMLGFGESYQDAPTIHRQDVLLLQIEGGMDIFWLPECMLHFWITRSDLATRAFDKVSATLECD
ncbi:MAG: DUF1963 domain-containing protein [Pseudomonadota bacterium]